MKKCLILPYFGQFNNYFDLWLTSIKINKDIDWFIFTDNKKPKDIPDNVIWIMMSFRNLKTIISNKLDIDISLEKPYKLCDYKPLYGYIFEDFIKEYDFWGYCDCDLIFGKISHFLTDDLFENYDKLLRTGHLSFIRNSKEINKNFFNYSNYKIIFSSPIIYGYDETIFGYHDGFAGEMIKSGYKVYVSNKHIGDVDFRYFDFNIVGTEYKNCLFTRENGSIYMLINNGKEILKKEMMYVHLQKRKMENDVKDSDTNILICPNSFIEFNKEITLDFFTTNEEKKKGYYDFKKEKIDNILYDIKRFFHEPKKIESLIYRFKGEKK